MIGDRLEHVCAPLGVEIFYAFQEIYDVPIPVPEGRTKPWGTGHAVLACEGLLDGPFAVINADDYYGSDGFVRAAEFLRTGRYGLVGYILKNTLSDNGGVTRGICSINNGKPTGIKETKNIIKDGDGASSDGKALDMNAMVSMNFWCFPIGFMDVLREGFPIFLANMRDRCKEEYLLPTIVDGILKQGTEVTVLPTEANWFGVTYQEDKASVMESFRKLYGDGVYEEVLYHDLRKRDNAETR